MELKKKHTQKNESENEEEYICRICYEKEKNYSEKMICPCKCKGSIKWVHKECLKKWITISKQLKCNTCKYQYKLQKICNYPNLLFLENDKIIKVSSLIILGFFIFISSYINYNYLGKNKFHNSNVLYFLDGLKLLTFSSFIFIGFFHYFDIFNIEEFLNNISYYGVNSIYDIMYIFYQIINRLIRKIISYKIKYNYIIENYKGS